MNLFFGVLSLKQWLGTSALVALLIVRKEIAQKKHKNESENCCVFMKFVFWLIYED